MADAKSGSREGGGRGGSADPLRGPGGRRKRSTAHTTRSLGPRPSEEPTAARPRAVSAARPPRRGGLPSPTPAQGNGAGRLRAGKAFGQSGLRANDPFPESPRPTATRAAAFPPLARPSARGGGGRLLLRRLRPHHALSKNSLISNPLPPSRTQSLQPDSPQPSETRKTSADAHAPDSS